jgi:hypothetical protein
MATTRTISTLGWVLRGAAAGAAGTTALNAVTYLDMAGRGRGTSDTPEQTVEALAEKVHVQILTGLVAGVGIGALAGLARAAGLRTPPLVGTALTTVGVLIGTNGPMTALGITDPRTWSATDWVSDVVPHLAYAVVVESTLDAFTA